MDETVSGTGATAHWRGQPVAALLFDLDGTLLDTAADIALALNRAFADAGWPALPPGTVRALIGRGAPILVRRAAQAQQRALDDATHAALVEGFFRHYGALQDSPDSTAQPYPGVREALRELHGAGLRTAVVTNKQRRFALALLQRLDLAGWLDVVVGGDSCERRKPDPQPLAHACTLLGVAPGQSLMIGDSINDVQAARGAGIPVLCVPYGYNEGADASTLACDALLESLTQLPGLLGVSGSARASGRRP